MKNPPKMVKTVMAAVCVMQGIAPDRIPDPNKLGQYVNYLFRLIYYADIFKYDENFVR